MVDNVMKNCAVRAPTEVAFVDPGIPDLATLLRSIRSQVCAIVLDKAGDPVAQMAEAVAPFKEVQTIHIIVHGAPGEIGFSAGALSLETILSQERNLARIGAALD